MTIFRLLTAAVASLVTAGAALAADSAPDCRVGAYALDGGDKLVITPSDAPNLRYRMLDGRSGKLYPDEAGGFVSGEGWFTRDLVTVRVRFAPCAEGTLAFQRVGSAAQTARRVPLRVVPLTFERDGQALYGELVLPAAGPPKAIVVLQYGSGDDSAVLNNYVQHLLPLKGIGVFVFDKRGTGRSGGRLTGNFERLADDMAAAVGAVRARPEAKGAPLGLMGESQGGWVAPLAASKTPVDFVVVSYGLAVGIDGEDRAEMIQSLRARGYDDAVVAKGLALHDAATRVFASDLREGVDELERLKAAGRSEPWFAHIGGDYSTALATTPRAQFEDLRPFIDLDFDVTYDPVPVLAKLKTPMLWVMAGRDTEAPHEETKAILQRLQATGAPIDAVVFPNADHGIIAVDAGPDGPDGPKVIGRLAPGYLDLLGDWIATPRLAGPYGEAELLPRR